MKQASIKLTYFRKGELQAVRVKQVASRSGASSRNSSVPRRNPSAPASLSPYFRPLTSDLRPSANKGGAETVNIYVRKKGETTWLLLVSKRKRLPFDDDTPPAAGAALEEREYRAIGVRGDSAVGHRHRSMGCLIAPRISALHLPDRPLYK